MFGLTAWDIFAGVFRWKYIEPLERALYRWALALAVWL